MKIPKPQLLAAMFSIAATLSFVPAQVHADTYKIYDLGGTPGGHIIVGIDNLGQVVILNENGGIFNSYLTYNNGVLVNTTSTLPSLTYDNGAPCSPPAGFSVPTIGAESICNNGFVAFGSFSNPNGDSSGLYTGPVSSLTLIDGVGEATLKLNSFGDLAWTNGLIEENFGAIDLTTRATPELGSLLLVSTGCFSLLCVLGRKLS
jgi:hypothetical protein